MTQAHLGFVGLDLLLGVDVLLEMRERLAQLRIDQLVAPNSQQAKRMARGRTRTLTEATVSGRSCSSTRRINARLKLTSMMRESIMAAMTSCQL